ncbi:hypothetical protein YC2023_054026 [Brassica napus]
MESKKSSHAGASFLLISTIFLFFLSRQASSYQMLICSGLSTACSECKAERESTYGALCIQENSKSDRIYCCCKKSPPPSYYGPIEAPSS